MSAPVATLLSYRLGGADGVSVEARKWEWALNELGFTTRRVAGELDGLREDDTWLSFLSIDPPPGAVVEADALAAALAGSDLVVVENLCSLPLNPTASMATRDVLAEHDGRVVFHHHDLPWERTHVPAAAGIPPDRPDSLHVTISEHARLGMAEHRLDAHTIRNSFDFSPNVGDREATRTAIRARADDVVVLQPTRAIPRKEVASGVAFAEALDRLLPTKTVRYWLTGPAEDGFGRDLERVVTKAKIPVSYGRAPRVEDAYAASDVVAFPSSWEGFGNPVVEASIARRPVAVAHYPVLDELMGFGLRLFSIADPEHVVAWLRSPDPTLLEMNVEALRPQLDLQTLPDRIEHEFATVGWTRW